MMSRYEQERIDARRILLVQLLEIDVITDEEVDHEKDRDSAISFTLLRLSKKTKAERALDMGMESQSDAANADKFLYGDDGMPK